MCYNNPLAYGVDITPQMFAELAEIKNLVAIKESSGDVRRITDLRNAVGDRYALFCGVDDLVLESVLARRDRLDRGHGHRLPGGEPATSGTSPSPATTRPRGRSTAGTRRSCTSTRRSSSSSTSSSRSRSAASAPNGCARRACRSRAKSARRVLEIIRHGIETRPTGPAAAPGVMSTHRVRVIDSHTGGEPTRVVIVAGRTWHGLGRRAAGTVSRATRRLPLRRRERAARLRRDGRRAALEPVDPANAAAVIFFNNVGFLGMCGHGTIGLVATLALARASRARRAPHRDAGRDSCARDLHPDGRVSVRNVPTYRHRKDVEVEVEGHGVGAWRRGLGRELVLPGERHGRRLDLSDVDALHRFHLAHSPGAARVPASPAQRAKIDHIELFGGLTSAGADSRNFVLCPGKAYDRSPCGTGTSAKLACLLADGKLQPGETWTQESITGSRFEGSIEIDAGRIVPTVTGRAWITADSTLLLDSEDPCCWGIQPALSAPGDSATTHKRQSSSRPR